MALKVKEQAYKSGEMYNIGGSVSPIGLRQSHHSTMNSQQLQIQPIAI